MPALPALLATIDDQGLQRLAALWGVTAEAAADRQRLTTSLAARMRSPFAARGVWMQVPPATRLCLWQIVSTKSGVRRDLLPKKVKLPEAEVDKALDWLQARGLVTEEIPRQPIPIRPEARVLPAAPPEPRLVVLAECAEALAQTGAECCTPLGDRSRSDLSRLLQSFSWEALETLAQRCGVRAAPADARLVFRFPAVAYHPPSLADLRVQIQTTLEGTVAVFALLQQVPPDAARLWTWLWEQEEGRATWEAAQAALGLDPCTLEALLPVLEAHALVFDTLDAEGGRLVFLPASLYRQLQPAVAAWQADERALALIPLETPPREVQGGTPLLLYDLAVLVGWTQQYLAEVTKEDQLPKRTQSLLLTQLQGSARSDEAGYDHYPNLLLLAAREMQLLERLVPYEGSKTRLAAGPRLAAWAAAEAGEQARQVVAWWEQTLTWREATSGEHLFFVDGWQVRERRRRLLSTLRTCVPERWYRTDALLYAIWKQTPLDLARSSPQTRKPAPHPLRAQWLRWQEREGAAVLALLTATLGELGLVETGDDERGPPGQSEAPSAFRLTTHGAAALDVEQEASPETRQEEAAVPRLILQPSFEIVLLPTWLPWLYRLLPWAEITHLGQASTLRLTQHSVQRGLANGGRLEELLTFLTGASGRELPQNVSYSLADWAKGVKGAAVASVILIEVSSAEAVPGVIRLLEAQRLAVQRLSPTLLALSADLTTLGVVHRTLEQAGVAVQRRLPSPTHLEQDPCPKA